MPEKAWWDIKFARLFLFFFIFLFAGLASSFTSEPRDMSVFLGDTAVFECDVSNMSPTENPLDNQASNRRVKWLRDEQPFPLDHRMKVMPSGLLEIREVTFSDRGSYRCEVTDQDAREVRKSKSGNLLINLGETKTCM